MEEMTFLVDTREKRPYTIPCSEKQKLDVGDYSLKGFTEIMSVERKSFDDLYNSLTTSLRRFKSQIRRLGKLKYKALIIDSTLSSILLGHVMCEMPGELALRRLLALCADHDVPIFFADRHGDELVQALLAEWWRREERIEFQEGK